MFRRIPNFSTTLLQTDTMANSNGADYFPAKWGMASAESPGRWPGIQGGQGVGQRGGQGGDSLTKWGMASTQSPTTPLFMQDQTPANCKHINVIDVIVKEKNGKLYYMLWEQSWLCFSLIQLPITIAIFVFK